MTGFWNLCPNRFYDLDTLDQNNIGNKEDI